MRSTNHRDNRDKLYHSVLLGATPGISDVTAYQWISFTRGYQFNTYSPSCDQGWSTMSALDRTSLSNQLLTSQSSVYNIPTGTHAHIPTHTAVTRIHARPNREQKCRVKNRDSYFSADEPTVLGIRSLIKEKYPRVQLLVYQQTDITVLCPSVRNSHWCDRKTSNWGVTWHRRVVSLLSP